jgi:hypothetical protein
MRKLACCAALLCLLGGNHARGDEFANVDPTKLAKGIEILADAWRIETVVFLGATDDFAEDKLFERPDRLRVIANAVAYTDGSNAAIEEALAGLFAEDEIADVIGEISRLRRPFIQRGDFRGRFLRVR